jgi:hypothetical protein
MLYLLSGTPGTGTLARFTHNFIIFTPPREQLPTLPSGLWYPIYCICSKLVQA